MRNVPTTDKAIAFIAKNPTFLGTVHGDDFYEHPTRGDEAPLVIITPEGFMRMTAEWELPSPQDYRSY